MCVRLVIQNDVLAIRFAGMVSAMLEPDPAVRVDMAWVGQHDCFQAVNLQGVLLGFEPNPLLDLP